MRVSAIWAQDRQGVIGSDNQIPWYLPDDLKYFKRCTLGHHIISGRKNFESIGKPLPRRTNIIVTRNPFYAVTGCVVLHSVEEALSFAFANGDDEAFIVGGGEIYRLAMPYVDKLYITDVDAEVEGDVYAPEIDRSSWDKIGQEFHPADDRHKFSFTFRVFERAPRLQPAQ